MRTANMSTDTEIRQGATGKPKINSRQKGARGERQWRDELRANGYAARRGQQFSGSADSPDVVCDDLAWAHFEVKAVERLNIYDAMAQTIGDCGGKKPIVAHRRNRGRWLVTIEAETFFRLLRGDFPQNRETPEPDFNAKGARSAETQEEDNLG